jgi:hypothetical protein
MKVTKRCTYLLPITLLAIASCPSALATSRATGEMISYEIKQTTTSRTDLSSLPASIRARAEQNQAAANGKTMTTNLALTVDSIDSDGNAHVSAKFTQSMDGVSGNGAAVLAGAKEFQGTLTADGRFLPILDPSASPSIDSHGRYTSANASTVNAQQMQGMFLDFNAFVTGASKRSKFKTGDNWHLSMQDAIGITRQYDFSVVELDSSNPSSALISMKFEFSSDTSSQKLTASGHYDAASRILTTYHEDNVYSSTANGMSSSGETIMDIKLRK